MHLFYTPDLSGETYKLNEEESKHCIRVLRLQTGDQVNLIDGKGNFYTAEIIEAHPKHTHLRVVAVDEGFAKRNHYLHIAIAPTKSIDRLEWFLEKATEIGIDEITPILCERSERKDVKIDRLNKIITSAVKQSLKAYHPHLNESIRFRDFIAKETPGEKYIAHCIADEKSPLDSKIKKQSRYTILIGPEGDFSRMEVDAALASGYTPITLGSSRLRTETAALAACFEINFLNR
jgi:16S rRNA (uracil1498-N3)-methyltransferase